MMRAVLLAAAGGSALLWGSARDLAVGILVAVLHFFLFCNVFRVPRPLELAWAGILVADVAVLRMAGIFSWSVALSVQTPVTLAVLIWTVRSPEYRGIGS